MSSCYSIQFLIPRDTGLLKKKKKGFYKDAQISEICKRSREFTRRWGERPTKQIHTTKVQVFRKKGKMVVMAVGEARRGDFR